MRISALEAWKTTFFFLGREIRLLSLLTLFMAVLSVLYIYPWLDAYISLLNAIAAGDTGPETLMALAHDFDGIWLVSIPATLFTLGVYALLSRAVILGQEYALEGGFGVLFKRAIQVFWRFICLMGWSVVLGVLFSVALFLAGIIFGAGALATGQGVLQPEDIPGSLMLVVFLLFGVFFFIVMALSILFYISLHGEARDFRLPIYKSYQVMRGNLVPATGSFFGFAIIFFIISGFVFNILSGAFLSSTTWLTTLALLVLFAMSIFFNFALVTFGAIYANRLVPELKS